MQDRERTLAVVRAHADPGLRGRGDRFGHEPQARTRAARRHLVAGVLRHVGERVLAVDPLERADRRVGVLRLERNVEDLAGLAEARERLQPRGAVPRVPADRAECLRVVHEADDGGAHLGARAVARDEHELLRPPERQQLPGGLDRPRRLVRLRRNAGQPAHRFRPHVFVRVRPGDFGQHRHFVDARDRRAAHAGLGVFPGERAKRLDILRPELVHGGRPDRRIRVLPPWLRTKLLENSHRACTHEVTIPWGRNT